MILPAPIRHLALASLLVASATAAITAHAGGRPALLVDVSQAWIRPAVAGQSGTGGYMGLTSREDVDLIGFRSPVARSAELHEMRMEDGVMRMRAVDALPLPQGKTVSLQASGHHLMLMGLKKPLRAGQQVPLTLLLRKASGKTVSQAVLVPVMAAAPAPSGEGEVPADHHDGDHQHHHGDH